MKRANSLENTLILGKDWEQEKKWATEDEMVGLHHQLSGHEFEQTLGESEGQGSLACCSPWGHRVWHDWVTKQQQKCCRTWLEWSNKKITEMINESTDREAHQSKMWPSEWQEQSIWAKKRQQFEKERIMAKGSKTNVSLQFCLVIRKRCYYIQNFEGKLQP